MSECTSCKFREGDCGHHHVDYDGNLHLDIPGLASCDRYGQCEFWKRSNASRRKEIVEKVEAIMKALQKIKDLEDEIATVEKQDKEEQKRKAEEEKKLQTMIFECKLNEVKKEVDSKVEGDVK